MLTYKDLLFANENALCIVDSDFNIIDCNYSMCLLTGLDVNDIIGQRLSNLICDDALIDCMSSDLVIKKGDCLLKTIYQIPILVKYMVGLVKDEYTMEGVYVISFIQINNDQNISRKLKAIRALIESIIDNGMKTEGVIRSFIREYDENADVLLLNNDHEISKLISQNASIYAQLARDRRSVIFYNEECLCFIPIYFQEEVYSIICVKFLSHLQLYNSEDVMILELVGKLLGVYVHYSKNIENSIFSVIFDNIDQPIIIVNEKGIITNTNSAARNAYGYCAFDMLGKPFIDLLPADVNEHYEDIFSRLDNDQPIYKEEMTHVRSDMSLINFKVTALPITSKDGKIIVYIMQNIDEQKKLQNKIMQWEKLTVLGELLHSAANELNNSLTTLIGNAKRLIQKDFFTDIDDIAGKIYKSSIRCAYVVNGLLDISRDNDPNKTYSNLNGIIGAALDLKQYQLKANNINVIINLDEDVYISADLHDVERMFLHIIDYAEKRILECSGGSLIIETCRLDDNVYINFTDTGTCIIADDINYQLNHSLLSSLTNEDIGIELISACQILRKIGGKIHVDSQIGKGTTISIVLPISQEQLVTAIDNSENALFQVVKSGKRVMVIDDEPDIIELLNHFLAQMGFIVDSALDGNSAMEKISKNNYDLIISDLKMPNGFTGDKLHKFIKYKDPQLAQRMIFMTGDMINHETQKFLVSTGNPYLEKPFLPESLLKIIDNMLSSNVLS